MKTETEKKDWQKGYDLDYLIDIQDNVFEIYNKKVLNPFLVMKKNRVADALWKDELFRTTNHTGGFQIYIFCPVSTMCL